MEFTRLADVEVVETANDTDKVLIEQNGEIKRVPKTEVGGSGGGNTLVLNLAVSDSSTMEMSLTSSSMTLDEAITAMNNNELTGAMIIMDMAGVQKMFCTAMLFSDGTAQMGSACVGLYITLGAEMIPIMWTADGIQVAN